MIHFIASILLLCSFFGQGHAGLYLNVKHLTPAHKHAQDAEKRHGIPENLLTAIAHVESKCSPYAVNAQGRGHYFKSHEQATKFVEELRAQGVRNINVGYMQLNVPSHLKRFSSVHAMLDVKRNIDFAAALLVKLHRIYGSWPRAVERYKSNFCSESKRYQNHVYSIMTKVKLPRTKDSTDAINVSHSGKRESVASLTLHKGSLHHTLNNLTSILPRSSQTGIIKATHASMTRTTLKTLQSTTFTHLVQQSEKTPLAWKKTYYFGEKTLIQKKKASFLSKVTRSIAKAYDQFFRI
jgi:hypothetical protein